MIIELKKIEEGIIPIYENKSKEKRYRNIINTNNNTNQFIEIMQNAINSLFLNVYMII